MVAMMNWRWHHARRGAYRPGMQAAILERFGQPLSIT
jgi:hypothetical protein